MSEIATMLMSALTDYGAMYGGEFVKGAVQKAGGELFVALKNRIWGGANETQPQTKSTASPESVDRLIEYLQRQDRVLETTLQCLEQLSKRIQENHTSSARNPTYVAIGIAPVSDQGEALTKLDVQSVLRDVTPGVPQTIKSGFALAHMCKGNKYLAENYARSILKSNPADPGAHFVLAHVLLQTPLRDIEPWIADKAEVHLATASEAGLAPQSALPRAALRIDHYKYRGRRGPVPSVADLSLAFEANRTQATAWPYRQLNNRLPISRDFRTIWGGVI
jgi:hypothetical protein